MRFLAEQMKLLPNQLTAARIVLLPILWAFAFLKLPVVLGIGPIISFATDVLDGYAARRLGQVSAFGSKLDSLADNLLIPSGLVWLWMLKPEVYRFGALPICICIPSAMARFSCTSSCRMPLLPTGTVCRCSTSRWACLFSLRLKDCCSS